MTAAHCEAKLHGFRKTQDGIVVSFVLHPQDWPQQLALDPLGTRYMLAVAQIGEELHSARGEQNAVAEPSLRTAVVPERAENRDAAIVKRAGILANDPRFWDWIAVPDTEAAAEFIRRSCGVKSRRDLATNDWAASRFQGLLDEYLAQTGQRAEIRG